MSDIIRVTIEKGPGFGLDRDHAFTEQIIIRPASIRYKYIPMIASEMNPPGYWVYKTNSLIFKKFFKEVAEAVEKIINWGNTVEVCCDAARTAFLIRYSDGSKKRDFFFLSDEDFEECYFKIRQMVPRSENMPYLLRTNVVNVNVEKKGFQDFH